MVLTCGVQGGTNALHYFFYLRIVVLFGGGILVEEGEIKNYKYYPNYFLGKDKKKLKPMRSIGRRIAAS